MFGSLKIGLYVIFCYKMITLISCPAKMGISAMHPSGTSYKPCRAGLACKFLQVSESHASKATALDVPKPVRILPIYNMGVYTGLGVRARVSHPSAKGTLRASRAARRPNRSRSGPHSKHPSGVAMDATLAETGNSTN